MNKPNDEIIASNYYYIYKIICLGWILLYILSEFSNVSDKKIITQNLIVNNFNTDSVTVWSILFRCELVWVNGLIIVLNIQLLLTFTKPV